MANWIIDRTINLDFRKTVRVLQLLLETPRKEDSMIEKQLMEENVLKKGSDGALRRRWYTYLRNYGLLHENTVTEMGEKYANELLSLDELALLQMIKRKIKIPSGNTVSPLKIIVLALKKLIELQGVDGGYLSQAEFSRYVVNIENESEESINSLVEEICKERHSNVMQEIVSGEHTDIWFNNFKQTGVFIVLGKCIFVDESKMGLFNLICDVYTSPVHDNISRFEDRFISNIPSVNFSKENIQATANDTEESILYDYLFEGMSCRMIAEKYQRGDVVATQRTLDAFGIFNSQNKGMFGNFASYPRIIIEKLKSSEDSKNKLLANTYILIPVLLMFWRNRRFASLQRVI